jgi:hypothetical protein
MIYVLTGPVGSGKSAMATERLIKYAQQGRRVVIDEAGTFLNARTWGQDGRQKIIRWMLLSRKRRWDMILIVQAVNILDKQIREAVVEVCGRIRRTDRIKVPLTGIALPRMHIANMRYGTSANDVVIERWFSRGADAFKCYDTTALFESNARWTDREGKPYKWLNLDGRGGEPSDLGTGGAYSVLPATLTKWRYIPLGSVQKAVRWVRDFVVGVVKGPEPVKRPKARKMALPGNLDPDRKWKLAQYLANLPRDRAERVLRELDRRSQGIAEPSKVLIPQTS